MPRKEKDPDLRLFKFLGLIGKEVKNPFGIRKKGAPAIDRAAKTMKARRKDNFRGKW